MKMNENIHVINPLTCDRVIQVGQLLAKRSQAYTLYDANGLCPTIASGQKRYGGLPVWIRINDSDKVNGLNND